MSGGATPNRYSRFFLFLHAEEAPSCREGHRLLQEPFLPPDGSALHRALYDPVPQEDSEAAALLDACMQELKPILNGRPHDIMSNELAGVARLLHGDVCLEELCGAEEDADLSRLPLCLLWIIYRGAWELNALKQPVDEMTPVQQEQLFLTCIRRIVDEGTPGPVSLLCAYLLHALRKVSLEKLRQPVQTLCTWFETVNLERLFDGLPQWWKSAQEPAGETLVEVVWVLVVHHDLDFAAESLARMLAALRTHYPHCVLRCWGLYWSLMLGDSSARAEANTKALSRVFLRHVASDVRTILQDLLRWDRVPDPEDSLALVNFVHAVVSKADTPLCSTFRLHMACVALLGLQARAARPHRRRGVLDDGQDLYGELIGRSPVSFALRLADGVDPKPKKLRPLCDTVQRLLLAICVEGMLCHEGAVGCMKLCSLLPLIALVPDPEAVGQALGRMFGDDACRTVGLPAAVADRRRTLRWTSLRAGLLAASVV